MANFLCVCLSSTIQKTIVFNKVRLTEVNRSTSYRLDASGKAINTARILTQIHPESTISICPLGENNAALFDELALRDNMYIDYVTIPGFTRECCTLLDMENHTTTELVVGEPAVNLTENQYKKIESEFLKKIKSKLEYADYVLLAGSRPVFWEKDIYARIAKMCLDEGKIFLADFHGQDLQTTLDCCTPSIIKINQEEFEATFYQGKKLSESELKDSIIEKSSQLKNMIIITRGTEVTFAANKGDFYTCPIIKLEPVNTTACGDSFNAGFLHELSISNDFELALKEGTWCAAQNALCQCPGSVRTNI